MRHAKASVLFVNESDLLLLERLFSRLNIIVRDVELEDPNLKKAEPNESRKLLFEKAAEFVLEKNGALLKRLAESERTEPRFELVIKNLHEIDLKAIEPILKRLAFGFEIIQTK